MLETILDVLTSAPVIVAAGVATMIVATRDLVRGEVPPHPHRQVGGVGRHRGTTAAHLRAYTVVLTVVFVVLVMLRFGHLGA
ncbi:MAG TPA: hypothetical protein VM688_03825 [Nocardioidaceae bacterium]|jgi:hypothetical protein|nr:hypothetical protein [Nocardioidaceae bacterium]